MLSKKLFVASVLAIVLFFTFSISTFAQSVTSPDVSQPNKTYAKISPLEKYTTGKYSPNDLIAVCSASLNADQNNPTMLEGNTEVICSEPLEVTVNSYADYCTAWAWGVCWGSWDNKASYSQCSMDYTTDLFCGTFYKTTGKNQVWRFRSEICVVFTTGTECTEEYKVVTF
ncbi:hypothetical protein [Tengunoibacter tsumagoiensis]|uniref:Uncharacterized protein n=1 Tax=Tengunoibacter tsumagoiensis TaxID=2014871 RepID=A0A401ZYB4_9CHLR|nr:hypothetical protein [Tengunoibacter tsumagoiensis]GCE11846.1 hypothetical protein KTT_17050 [Tengunoibacter tsumagoiensis]